MGMFTGMKDDEWDAEYTNYRFDAPNEYLVSIIVIKKTEDESFLVLETSLLAKKRAKEIDPLPGEKVSHVISLKLKPRFMGISRKKIKAIIIAGYTKEALCETFDLEDIKQIDEDSLETLASEVINENAFEGLTFVVKSKTKKDKDTGEISDFPEVTWHLADESDYETFGVTME